MVMVDQKRCEGCGELFRRREREGMPYWRIRRYCSQQCFRRHDARQRQWTEEELATLRTLYPRYGAREASKQLGRTLHAVSQRARMLGLRVQWPKETPLSERLEIEKRKAALRRNNTDSLRKLQEGASNEN